MKVALAVLAKVLVAAALTSFLSRHFYASLWLHGAPVPPPPGYELTFFTGSLVLVEAVSGVLLMFVKKPSPDNTAA